MANISVLVVADGTYLSQNPPRDGINLAPGQDLADDTFTVSEFIYPPSTSQTLSISSRHSVVLPRSRRMTVNAAECELDVAGLEGPMARAIVFFAIAIFLVSCSSPVIQNVQDPTGQKAIPANIEPLKSYFETATGRVNIVLVHGVGFHCPTYGLDPKSGWLNKDTLASLGLVPIKNAPDTPPQFIPDMENGVVDANSGVYLMQRTYTYTRQDKASTEVEISEITWSGLTAWLKLQELGGDFSVIAKPGDGEDLPPGTPTSVACPGIANTSYPFSRQILNRVIKESTLDSAMSDAVIYVGTYGVKIEQGVAEVLCRLVSAKTYAELDRCQWSDADAAKLKSSFIFMTHSLGSRIVFDTLLDLDRHPTRGSGLIFENVGKEGRQSVEQIIINTRSIYMFANQLPLLTLADVPPTRKSDESPSVIDLKHYTDIDAPRHLTDSQAPAASTTQERAAPHLLWFATVKSTLSHPQQPQTTKLDVVAFSDPNDLLSYIIPPWFQQDMGDLQFQITNVSVQNAFHWLHVIESPTDAHDRYMANPDVWKVIRCGAIDGKLNCP